MAGETHSVKAGEHAAKVAALHGFGLFETVWNTAENAAIRAKRPNPNTLLPGDEVAIPQRKPGSVVVGTGQAHSFKLTGTQLRLRVKLQDFLGRPLANVACKVETAQGTQSATTDQDGLLDVPISSLADKATVTAGDQQVELFVGFLPPIEDRSGVLERLSNLGYLADVDDDDAIALALEEFQVDQGLDRTGQIDEPTRAKLLEVHGC